MVQCEQTEALCISEGSLGMEVIRSWNHALVSGAASDATTGHQATIPRHTRPGPSHKQRTEQAGGGISYFLPDVRTTAKTGGYCTRHKILLKIVWLTHRHRHHHCRHL